MIDFAAMHRVRKHPVFADYFAFVPALFWPILFWNLLRMADRMDAAGRCQVLLQVHWWGYIEITHFGDPQPSPSAYRPLAPTRKPWDDPALETALPAFLGAEARAVICLRANGGFEGKASALQTPREGMKGAFALSPTADTS